VKAQLSGAGIGRTICTSDQIAEAVGRLAASIAEDYRRKPLLLLGVLKGALCFTADLARAVARAPDGPSELIVDYIMIERYGFLGITGDRARLVMDCVAPIAGANVLVADDIVDNGRTMDFLANLLRERKPASLRSCALFDRPERRDIDVRLDYVGVAIPDVFTIGYGLDYKELYRNLPYLAQLRESRTV
jgi:hypoxanthine phosphoribosyltransferase